MKQLEPCHPPTRAEMYAAPTCSDAHRMSNGPQNGRTFFYPPRLSLGFEAPRTFGNKAKYKDAFIAFDNYHRRCTPHQHVFLKPNRAPSIEAWGKSNFPGFLARMIL